MKTILLLILSCGLAYAEPSEKVILVHNDDLTAIQKLLNAGFTVKHQSVAMSATSYGSKEYRQVILFTLTPPKP